MKTDFDIRIMGSRLSDGSEVYSVRLQGEDLGIIDFECIDEKHAEAFEVGLSTLIKNHTTETVYISD